VRFVCILFARGEFVEVSVQRDFHPWVQAEVSLFSGAKVPLLPYIKTERLRIPSEICSLRGNIAQRKLHLIAGGSGPHFFILASF